MSRLTYKADYEYEGQYGTNGFDCIGDKLQDVYDKLGRLEDLLEKYECPLEVVFKALENGIYTQVYDVRLRDGDDELTYYRIVKLVKGNKLEIKYSNDCYEHYIYLKDYKETWWLEESKEE